MWGNAGLKPGRYKSGEANGERANLEVGPYNGRSSRQDAGTAKWDALKRRPYKSMQKHGSEDPPLPKAKEIFSRGDAKA